MSEQRSVNAETSGVPILRTGPEWVVLDQSPINGKAYLLATDPRNSGRLYAGGQGVFRSDDFGKTWSSLNEALRPVILVVDSSTPDRLYVLSGGSIWRSADAGAIWTRIAGPPNSVTSLLVDAAGTLYAIGLEGAFRSTTAGESWSEVTPVPADTSFGGPTTLIATDPLAPGVLYATSGNPFFWIKAFKTIDGASSWKGPIFEMGIDVFLTSLEVSATSPSAAWRGVNIVDRSICGSNVDVSLDGEETWIPIFGGPRVGPIVTDPVRPKTAYVGTSKCFNSSATWGVYQLTSSGHASPLGQGEFVVQNLAVAPDGSILYAIAGGKLAILRIPSHPTPMTVPFR